MNLVLVFVFLLSEVFLFLKSTDLTSTSNDSVKSEFKEFIR